MLNMWYFSAQISLNRDETGTVANSVLFLLINVCVTKICSIPIGLYRDFVLEERYGFNKKTLTLHMNDIMKITTLQIIFEVLMLMGASYIVSFNDNRLYIWLWFSQMVITAALTIIIPIYILPLFNVFTPLPEGCLKNAIADLAKSVDFPLSEILVMDSSQRTSHANAFFAGFIGTKRIVLYDNLLAENDSGAPKYEEEEILAILCHELGHWKNQHVLKEFVIKQILNLFILMIYQSMINYSPMYRAFGFSLQVQPIVIGFIILREYLLMPIYWIEKFIMNHFRRSWECQADAFAVDMCYGEQLKTSLMKIE